MPKNYQLLTKRARSTRTVHFVRDKVAGADARVNINVALGPQAGNGARQRLAREVLKRIRKMSAKDLKRLEEHYGSMRQVAEAMLAAVPQLDPVDDIVGPFRTTASMIALTGLTRQGVHERVKAGTVLSVMTSDSQRLFPDFQFDENGESLPRLREVLSAFGGSKDAWDAALWLAQPDRDLGGRTPAQALRSNDADFVVELARRAGSVLAS